MAFNVETIIHRMDMALECWIGDEDHGGFVVAAQMTAHTVDVDYDFFLLYSQLKGRYAILPPHAYRRGFYTSECDWFVSIDAALRRYEDAEEGPIDTPFWRSIKKTFVAEHERLANNGFESDEY
jgi:hypothetical protein